MRRNDYSPAAGTALLSEQEKRQLLFDFNGNRAEFPYDKSVIHFIRDQALNTPGKIAVGCDNSQLTFGWLDERSHQLARYLRNKGIREDQTVGILLDRSLQMIESILAVWKAGGAYIPIETDYPLGRILEILKDSKSGVLLSGNEYVDSALEAIDNIKIINPDQLDFPHPDGETFPLEISMSSLAYVIYTSGSTGKPKGAMVEHMGMMNHMWAKIRDLQLTTHSIVVQDASHTFDISIWQFFAALTVGGKTAIYPHELIIEPEKFLDQLVKDRVTVLEVVPSYLSVILAALDTGQTLHLFLDYLVVTGEEVKPHLVRQWFAHYPHIKVVNAYGPTEASDDITHYIMDKAPEQERIPIGKPLQNFDIYIVDENINLCPVGVKGEIRVSGIGVGRGYLNNPELTAEKFQIPNKAGYYRSYRSYKSYILYKTGDLGRWMVDGNIEFFGRRDHQVKIRGFRIELGEIERRLLNDDRIKEAVVVDRENAQGNRYLCAYLVRAGKHLDIPGIKNYLCQQLPDYMVPAYFVEMEKIPLTVNGKIDRKALPVPGDSQGFIPYLAVMPGGEVKRKSLTAEGQNSGEQLIQEIEMIPAAQKRQILFEFNNTKKTIRRDKNYCQLFEEQVSGSQDKIAAVFNDHSITYDELNREARRIGVILAGSGVRVNSFVALYLDRSIAMLAAIIGVFKAGGAYVPIDVDYPAARIAYLFADSDAQVVITDKNNIEGLGQLEDFSSWERRPVICLDHGNPLANVDTGDSLKNIRETTGPDDLVYMMYTSGSTGKPKGAMIHQLGMLNHMFALIDYLSLGPEDIIAQDASASFDISRWQFLAAPMFGGRTFIIDNDILVNPPKLLKTLQQGKISILEAVPSLASAILNAGENEKDKELKYIRWMMLTGESLGVQLVRDWCHQYPGVKTLNAYGPTEASDDVTFHLIHESPGEKQFTVPIGKPLQNLHIYIMDRNLHLCPIGVEGEICVAGLGVGKGYWKDPLKTENSFVPNPLLDEIQDPDYAILYRTGDIGYSREDGTCECLGRIDHQVKIRGLRIETGEIESYLIRYKDIKEAVVVLCNEDQGEKYLKACIVSSKRLMESDLRKYLSKDLPHYMIPTSFVQLEKLPLTPNGKVDRKLLQTLEVPGESHEKVPRDEVEKKLANIWAEVLGIEAGTIGRDANFFQLGGDSILCLQMVLKAKQAGIAITSTQVFNHPVIEELPGIVKDRQQEESHPSPTPAPLLTMDEKEREQLIADNPGTRDIYPLTPIQQQMFSYNLLAGGSGETILHLSWVMTGHLDIAAFEKAWQTVAQRHCILRTAFKRRRFSEPLQLVYTAVTIPFQQLDCSGMTEAGQNQALADYLLSDKERRFKMSRAPLMRLYLVILNNHSYRLICSYSSLLLDNWSSIIIVKEVFHYYDAFIGKKLVNREKPRPLKDYVQWLLGREQTGAKQSWRNELQGFDSTMELGIQRLSRENISKNFTPTHLAIRLLPGETRRLTTWAREHQLTLGTILQGAWIITLSYLSGEEDVLSGVLSYGRSDDFPGIDSMVGLFINTIPVRVKVPARQDLITWLKEFQDQQVRLRQFDYVTIDYISRWSGVPLDKIQKAIYERTFVLAKSPGQEFFSGLSGNNSIKISQFDDSLILNVPFRVYAELSEHTIIRLQYDASCFLPDSIRKMAGCLEKLLRNIMENPGVLVGDLKSNKMMK